MIESGENGSPRAAAGSSPAQAPPELSASRKATVSKPKYSSSHPVSLPPKGILRDYFETIVICVIFVIFSRAFVFQQSKIPTGSMEQTLLIGDYIMVNRYAYAPSPTGLEKALLPVRDPRRHDIIVFRYPEEPEVDYIKRVVGLPGEKVEVRKGVVYIDDEPIEEDFLGEEVQDRSSWGPRTIPAESYFVMGDNRANSRDSRFWGWVPRHYIKGRAFIIWFSYEDERDDWKKSGLDRFRTTIGKIIRFPTRTRWSRCFSLIR